MEDFHELFYFGTPPKKTERLVCGHPTYSTVIELPDAISKSEQKLLKKTLTNLGCPYGEFEPGFLCCHHSLTLPNEQVLFRRIKFEVAAKYLFMDRFIWVCKDWSLGMSWIKERSGTKTIFTGKKRKKCFKKNPRIEITSKPLINQMFGNSLASYNVLDPKCTTHDRLRDCGWPGHDEIQRVRMKAMFLLPRSFWPEFACQQVWGNQDPLIILDVMDTMLTKLELENHDIFSTPKKEKRKLERDTTVVKKLKLEATISQSVEALEVNVSTTTDNVSTDVHVRISDSERARRTGSPNIQYRGAHYQGFKVFNKYKKTIEDRNVKVVVKKQTWYEILFWSVALYAMDLYMPYLDSPSEVEFLIGFFIGAILLLRCVFFSPHYVWTIVTITYVRWIDTNRFMFVPGEIYATIALQMLLVERKKIMIIPVIGFLVYSYFTEKKWTILIQYSLALLCCIKGVRFEESAKAILVAPYQDAILLVTMIFFCVCSCNVS